jgi:hypothetical protein
MTSTPKRQRRRTSFYIKAVAGILTFAATMAGAYLGFVSFFNSTVHATDWARKANAVCDQDSGDLTRSLSDGLVSISHLTTGQSSGDEKQAAVHALIADAGVFGKMLGKLRDLPPPADHRSEVKAVLSAGNVLVVNQRTLALDMQTLLLGTPDANNRGYLQITTEVSAALKAFNLTVAPAWRKAIGALDLTQCPLWVSDPNVTPTRPGPPEPPLSTPTQPTATTSPPSPPAPSSVTNGEQQLINLLDTNNLTGCTRRPDVEGSWVVAAVNCSTVVPGPTKRPLVVRFADAASAGAWFTSNTRGIVDENNCAAGRKLGTWTWNNVNVGALGCTVTTDGGFRMVWVIDSALIGVVAEGSDGVTMNGWWRKWAYVVSSGGLGRVP